MLLFRKPVLDFGQLFFYIDNQTGLPAGKTTFYNVTQRFIKKKEVAMRYKKLVARVKDELGEEKLRVIDSSKSFRVLFYLLIGFLNFLLLAGLVIAMIALCTEK